MSIGWFPWRLRDSFLPPPAPGTASDLRCPFTCRPLAPISAAVVTWRFSSMSLRVWAPIRVGAHIITGSTNKCREEERALKKESDNEGVSGEGVGEGEQEARRKGHT